ncbi:MAG: sigma 54-interacting transcriptional regulator, partial [Chitinispirillales bacterium]|nr:sigma 54-interacting transcriptional regulator [Chitinispirillales bacterium]
TDCAVLITGETGTGKSALARRIHELSPRSDKPFVDIYCPCLRGESLKSELFGHARLSEANSSAGRTAGLIEEADGGTLFLDEIGGMALEAQYMLLTAIEDKTFRRVGEVHRRRSDFRLICATSRSLQAEIAAGGFREDLFYRINAFPVSLPPLRARKKEMPALIGQILESLGYEAPLGDGVARALALYSWPGNIRQLRNTLERMLICAAGQELAPKHFTEALPPEAMPQAPAPAPAAQHSAGEAAGSPSWSLDDLERAHLMRALDHFGGDKFRVSEALGISLSTVYRKLDKFCGESHKKSCGEGEGI